MRAGVTVPRHGGHRCEGRSPPAPKREGRGSRLLREGQGCSVWTPSCRRQRCEQPGRCSQPPKKSQSASTARSAVTLLACRGLTASLPREKKPSWSENQPGTSCVTPPKQAPRGLAATPARAAVAGPTESSRHTGTRLQTRSGTQIPQHEPRGCHATGCRRGSPALLGLHHQRSPCPRAAD